jgi:hypothetical protein
MTARRLDLVPLAAGAAFGAVVQLGSTHARMGWWAFHLGVPWLACAFLAGAHAARTAGGRRARGAIAGAALMAAATLAYYAVYLLIKGPNVLAYGIAMSVAWIAVGGPLGGLFGAAGAVARAGAPRWRAACIALLGGALCGEALLLLITKPDSVGRQVFVLELAAGIACPLSLVPRRHAAWLGAALTAVLAGLAVLAGGGLRLFMHRYGWHGP